jgi:hypothetical protein
MTDEGQRWPRRIQFSLGAGARDPEVERLAVRRAFDLVASSLAPPAPGPDPLIGELETLLNEDPGVAINTFYGLIAITGGLVRRIAADDEKDPLDVLRRLEEAIESASSE